MHSEHPLFTILSDKRIILASQSPRRKVLLEGLGIDFEVIVKNDIDESFPEGMECTTIPVFLSEAKASAYREYFEQPNTLVITSDTIVWLDEQVIGKPTDYDDALNILERLSGNWHEVITGVTLTSSTKQHSFFTVTRVYLRNTSPSEREYYLHQYKPFDKAGAYGIQEWIGYAAVEKIEGSFHNVMGLPAQALYNELKKFYR